MNGKKLRLNNGALKKLLIKHRDVALAICFMQLDVTAIYAIF